MCACLKVCFTCNVVMEKYCPSETHIFEYKLCRSAYVLIYEHVYIQGMLM